MEKLDLRLVALSVAVSALLKKAGISAESLRKDMADFAIALDPQEGWLTGEALELCMETLEGLVEGVPPRPDGH